jgi:hypothetical protein
MLKYIQTQIPIPQFKRLKVEALDKNTTLGELLQEIIASHCSTLEKQEMEAQHGSKKVEKRSIRGRAG